MAAAALARTNYDVRPTFEAFVAAHPEVIREIGTAVLDEPLHRSPLGTKHTDVVRFALRRWKQCPALSAAIRANLFINRAVRSGKQLRHDVWDDLKHCVNAAYVDLFVTGDQGLADIFREIRPGPRIATTEQFLVEIGVLARSPKNLG